MKLNKDELQDIIEWDINNWSRSIIFWNQYLPSEQPLACLELGARRGGMSLWLSMLGHDVVCSDIDNPRNIAEQIHSKHKDKLFGSLRYEEINATNIPYTDQFDVIVFKSILGGIGSYSNKNNQIKALSEIYSALKPGGMLLFAENLAASPIHILLRKKFVNWGARWNYLKYSEINDLFSDFTNLYTSSFGFFADFGRSERQRKILSLIDKTLDRAIPSRYKYIVFGVAIK